MKPTFATKVTDYTTVCIWVSLHYRTHCFANISTWKVCTVTQKLDLDQMSERSTLKDTNVIKLTTAANFDFIHFV